MPWTRWPPAGQQGVEGDGCELFRLALKCVSVLYSAAPLPVWLGVRRAGPRRLSGGADAGMTSISDLCAPHASPAMRHYETPFGGSLLHDPVLPCRT